MDPVLNDLSRHLDSIADAEAIVGYTEDLWNKVAKELDEKEAMETPRIELHSLEYALEWAQRMFDRGVELAIKDAERAMK